jgi:hypothetical protein
VEEDEEPVAAVLRDDHLDRGVAGDAAYLDVFEVGAVAGALVGRPERDLEREECAQAEDQQRRKAAPADRSSRLRDGWG